MVPIKVALLGAPGSGKTKLANALARKLHGFHNTDGSILLTTGGGGHIPDFHSWKVIDGYVEKLSKRTGRTYGEVFNRYAFPLNIQVLAERWTLEDQATSQGHNTISCGSIYETIIYAAAQGIPIVQSPNEQWILEESQIARAMMSALSILASIRFDYDVLFFLPLDESNNDWAGVIDAKLDEVLDAQGLIALVLNGTHKERVQVALEAISDARDRQEPPTPTQTTPKAIESTV